MQTVSMGMHDYNVVLRNKISFEIAFFLIVLFISLH